MATTRANKATSLEEIKDLILSSEKKLSDKIDTINNNLQTAIDKINEEVRTVKGRLDQVETGVTFNQGGVEKVTEEVRRLQIDLAFDIGMLRREAILKDLHDRKVNLLFNGIPIAETSDTRENSEAVLKEFIVDKLNIPQERVEQMQFKTVHRIPRPRYNEHQAENTRPPTMIAAFTSMTDRNDIFYARKAVYGTAASIQIDMPVSMKKIRTVLNRKAYELRTNEDLYTRVRTKGIDLVLEVKKPTEPNTAWRRVSVVIPAELAQY